MCCSEGAHKEAEHGVTLVQLYNAQHDDLGFFVGEARITRRNADGSAFLAQHFTPSAACCTPPATGNDALFKNRVRYRANSSRSPFDGAAHHRRVR